MRNWCTHVPCSLTPSTPRAREAHQWCGVAPGPQGFLREPLPALAHILFSRSPVIFWPQQSIYHHPTQSETSFWLCLDTQYKAPANIRGSVFWSLIKVKGKTGDRMCILRAYGDVFVYFRVPGGKPARCIINKMKRGDTLASFHVLHHTCTGCMVFSSFVQNLYMDYTRVLCVL